MSNEQRDRAVLEKIIQYCNEAGEMTDLSEGTKGDSKENKACRYATAMCLMQIGELAGHLSDEAKIRMSMIAWNAIRGMRNVLAHDYVSVDWDVIWKTATKDLPILKLVCEEYLKG